MKLLILRGPSCVGKTTIALEVLKILKKRFGLRCAFIAEDDFRKKMQHKYKAIDQVVHLHSVELIKAVLQRLIAIDSYDIIIFEGLLRYPEQIAEYYALSRKLNINVTLFQLTLPVELRKKRNQIDASRDHTVDFDNPHTIGNGEEQAYPGSIIIDTSGSVQQTVELLLLHVNLPSDLSAGE